MSSQIIIFISCFLTFLSVFLITASGCVFSKKSGVLNIGLEGIMIFSNLISLLVLKYSRLSSYSPFLVCFAIIIISMLSGVFYSLFFSFLVVKLKANPTSAGMSINMISLPLAVFLVKFFSSNSSSTIKFDNSFFTLFSIGSLKISIFVILSIIVMIFSYFLLYHTWFGLRLRSCEEKNIISEINVNRYSFIGILISGALGGLGAISYVLSSSSFWDSLSGIFGLGFLSIAIMIFSDCKLLKIFFTSLIFSFLIAFSYCYEGIFEFFGLEFNYLHSMNDIIKMVPYIFLLVLMPFVSKKNLLYC